MNSKWWQSRHLLFNIQVNSYKNLKDAIPGSQEAVDPDLNHNHNHNHNLALEVEKKQRHFESVEPSPEAGSDTAVH